MNPVEEIKDFCEIHECLLDEKHCGHSRTLPGRQELGSRPLSAPLGEVALGWGSGAGACSLSSSTRVPSLSVCHRLAQGIR